jgi:hypothetical protein
MEQAWKIVMLVLVAAAWVLREATGNNNNKLP